MAKSTLAETLYSELVKDLDSGDVDVKQAREICKQIGIPSQLRPVLWKVFVDVHMKAPDMTESFDGHFDVENQDQLNTDAQILKQRVRAQSAEGVVTVAEEIDIILTCFCKFRRVPYKSELAEIIYPLLILPGMTRAGVYNTFNNIVTKYLPYLYPEHEKQLACFCMILRLVLQYHDPALSLHFDQNRVDPKHYIMPWLNTLFVNQFKDDKLHVLWDNLFLENNQILVNFIAIALYMSKRDILLNATGEELVQLCANLSLDTTEEVTQVVKAAKSMMMDNTPRSARNQLLAIAFPSPDLKFEVLEKVFVNSIVLPVPSTELIGSFRKDLQPNEIQDQIRYIIIDCRSLKSYEYSRLPTAIHIGSNVGYDSSKMNALIGRFLPAKGSHFAIFGTGRGLPEEENLLKIIAIKFLSSGFPHMSTTLGGFKKILPFITEGKVEVVSDHQSVAETSESILSNITSKVKIWGSGFFKKEESTSATGSTGGHAGDQTHSVATTVKKEGTTTAASNHTTSAGSSSTAKTVRANDKPSFILEDEENVDDKENLVNIDELNSEANVFVYACKAKEEDGHFHPRYIVVSDSSITSLSPYPKKLGYGHVKWQKTLRQLLRIIYNKENPKVITFVLKDEHKGHFEEIYVMQQSMECTRIIQENMSKLKTQKVKKSPRVSNQDSSSDNSANTKSIE